MKSWIQNSKKMKKFFFAVMALINMMFMANAQEFNLNTSSDGLESLSSYKDKRLEKLPYIQAFQADNGQILKAADTEGFGIEVFAGWHMATGFNTPEAGLSFRYDAKKVSYRLSASALTREYNDEALAAGERYWSYSADAAFHVNLFNRGFHENVLSLYGNIGYIYGQHRYRVGEEQVEEGTLIRTVKHNGSGVKFGGGIEYRRQFFASGNALTIRVGYNTLPNTFVNNTKIHGTAYLQVGFNFGCARNRVRMK